MIRTSGITAIVLIAGCSTASPTASRPASVELDPHTALQLRPVPWTGRPSPTPIRASRSRITVDGAVAWASTGTARAVAFCESGQDNSARSHTGKYRGKWQMDADFWQTYGGLRFAASPDLASEAEQDEVAYHGWLARGWEPWTCARIVGVYP